MTGQHDGTPLRRRVLVSILTVTSLAVAVFALPLAIAVQQLYRTETVTALQRDAARVAAVVPDAMPAAPISLPRGASSSASTGVYDTTGRRIAGTGPARSALAIGVGTQVRDAVEGADLAVFAPIPSDQKAAGTVRVAVPYSVVTARVYRAWAIMALFAALAIGLAAVLARRQAVRLAAPLERLTHAARALGDGDFTIQAQHSGVREADIASGALEATATRLGQLVGRAQAFGSDVSHQLRTPLTGLMVGLESALTRTDAELRPALRDALSRCDHLHTIVEDLITMTRSPGFEATQIDLGDLLADVRDRWAAPLKARGRALAAGPQLPPCLAPEAAVRQILDVLLGNALWHGEGTVTIGARRTPAGTAIEVSDEGPGLAAEPERLLAGPPDPADGHGRGLPLARALAAAAGGSLVVRRASPQPVFSLLLPAGDDKLPAAEGNAARGGKRPGKPAGQQASGSKR
jgi:signal transduction histidine kinase